MATLTLDVRLNLLEILPRQGNHITLRIIRELRESLALSNEELEILESWRVGDEMRWEPANAEKLTKDFEFGKTALETIIDTLKKREAQETLPEMLLDLYEELVIPATE